MRLTHPHDYWYLSYNSMIGTSICPEISISRTQPLPIPKIFPWAKKFRESVKNQRSEGLLKGSLCWCLKLTWATLHNSWKCHYYTFIESRNQWVVKNLNFKTLSLLWFFVHMVWRRTVFFGVSIRVSIILYNSFTYSLEYSAFKPEEMCSGEV